MTESSTTTNQRTIQAFAQRNNLSLDDAKRILLDTDRWDGLLESLRNQ